ncbi:flippase [Candidatus Saccharibacteria bacterium]|nr:flippase [Candidatus Saccharibacteria bacterium]
MARSIKKNFAYNFVYQVLILVFPLITTPYVSRVLGAEGIGAYSYTYSIMYYFMLVAMLGITNHGNRAIAKARENKEELTKTFWSIYLIQLSMSALMIIAYFCYILIFSPNYWLIAIIQVLYIFSAMFDISWLFFGLEEFKTIVIRSIIVKLLELMAIFLFVKNADDIWVYTLIMAGGALINQLVMWPFLINRVASIPWGYLKIKKHIKPCLVLFIPAVAVSLYKVMDKVMLGAMSGVEEVGYYEQAEKIVTMPLAIATALGAVLMPRMSNFIAKGRHEDMRRYIRMSMRFMMFLAFPLCFGLIAIADNFVPLFLGDGFEKSIILVRLLSITTVFLAFANPLRTGYIVPKEQDHVLVKFTILGAVVNLIINFALIPSMNSVGACIGTIAAEFAVMFYQAFSVRKDLPMALYLKDSVAFLIKSLLMFGFIEAISVIMKLPIAVDMILQIICGMALYFFMNKKFIKEIINFEK